MQTTERDRLINENISYSGKIATAFMSDLGLHGVASYDDVVAWGNVGLTEAAHRFRAENGTDFKTFSFNRIRGAIVEGLRWSYRGRMHHKHWKTTNEAEGARSAPRPRTRLLQDSSAPGLPVDGEPTVDPFETLDARFLRREIDAALALLPEIERQIVTLFHFEDLTRRRIAKRLGHSTSYISRRHKTALRTLVKLLGESAADFNLGGAL